MQRTQQKRKDFLGPKGTISPALFTVELISKGVLTFILTYSMEEWKT